MGPWRACSSSWRRNDRRRLLRQAIFDGALVADGYDKQILSSGPSLRAWDKRILACVPTRPPHGPQETCEQHSHGRKRDLPTRNGSGQLATADAPRAGRRRRLVRGAR